jgi:protein-disulfide isomerase
LVRFINLLAGLCLTLCFVPLGCSAQGNAGGSLPQDVRRKAESIVRAQYNVPPYVKMQFSDPKPSEVAGYDTVSITFTGQKVTTYDFLISKDRKTLARLEKMDLSADPMAKIDVKGRPVRGNPNAKVTIVNYDDFQCPFCSRMHSTLFPSLMKQYGDRVKIIYKDYPLVEIHPWAMHAAVDANCLADQNNDAYWEFADYVHANQTSISPPRGTAQPNWTDSFNKLDTIAREQGKKHGVNEARLNGCMQKQDESAIRASMAEAEEMRVDSTPTMFINGERLSGAIPEEEMKQILDRIIAESAPAAPAASAKK